MRVPVLKGSALFGNDHGRDFKTVKALLSRSTLCVIIVSMYQIICKIEKMANKS